MYLRNLLDTKNGSKTSKSKNYAQTTFDLNEISPKEPLWWRIGRDEKRRATLSLGKNVLEPNELHIFKENFNEHLQSQKLKTEFKKETKREQQTLFHE